MGYLYAAFILYLLGMLGIGYYFYRKTNTVSDYILGSRNLPPSVAALSSGASDLSGWALMGLPGALYAGGLGSIWIIVFTLMGVYINWKLIAPRLRLATEKLNDAQTIPEYLHNRFQDKNNVLQLTSSLVTLLFFTLYVAAGLSGGAVLFESTFDLSYESALIIGSIVIVSYTFMGGYLAVCWTDFFQGLMMAVSLFITALSLYFLFSSPDQGVSYSQIISEISLESLKPSNGWLLGLLSLSGWCIGYLGQPHVLVRFMSVRSVEDVKTSRRIAMIWSTITMMSAVVVGVLGSYYFEPKLDNAETVFIALAQAFYHPLVAGLIIAGVLAAIMSTIDSQLLVCSTTISEDLYKTYLRKNASDKEILLVARLGVIAVALVGLLLAFNKADKTLLSMVAFAWGGFGAAFGPVILLSLFWSAMTKTAAISGMVTGAAIALIWEVLDGGIFDIFGVVPGFLMSMLVIVVSTLLGHKKSNESMPSLHFK